MSKTAQPVESSVVVVTSLVVVVLFAMIGCGATRPVVDPVRYANQAPIWQVNDRKDVPTKPKEVPFSQILYGFDGAFARTSVRALEFEPPRRAENTNSLDEVPDSTWFTNRIGVRDLTREELRRGPNVDDSPELHKPWTILGTKVGGASVGFLIKDARGVRYLLKFDEKRNPEMETAADIITQRIMWACGYNAPQDFIVHFVPSDLVIDKKASVKDVFGNKRPMTQKDFDDGMAKINIRPGKPIRGLVSKFLLGKPIGGVTREGRRQDDPNDLIPHQHRRDLRGLQPIAAWLNHTDTKEGNSLDVWIEDPKDPAIHYVKHYFVDFGKTLGTMPYGDKQLSSGFAYVYDWKALFWSLASAGLWIRPWDGLKEPGIAGIGVFEADKYDPGQFKTQIHYYPFSEMDRFDGFWGAKIMMRFTREDIAAIVELAQYSDPRAAPYMVETLVARQRKTGRYWFEKVTPIDKIQTEPGDHGMARVCFDDLLDKYQLGSDSRSSYRAAVYDYAGTEVPSRLRLERHGAGRYCFSGVTLGRSNASYTILSVARVLGAKTLPKVFIHLAKTPAGELRVIGIRRT